MSTDPRIDRRGFLALGVGALAVAVAPPLLRPRERLVRRSFPVMGTVGEIAVPTRHEAGARAAIDAAVGELARIESLMTRFRTDSDVGRVAASAPGRAVAVSPETAEVVRDALAWAAETEGAFDPALGRLTALWDPRDGARPPEADRWAPLAGAGLWRALEVGGAPDAPWVRRHRPEAALDLGGIAKGYGVDRAADVLTGFGVGRGLINVGGDLVALGTGPDGRAWRVGIRDPRDPDGVVDTMSLEDEAVATSGDYLRFFEHGGRRYHHLIDPRTGAPRRSGLRTVTVRALDVRTADAAATAAFARAPIQRSGVRIVHRG